MDDQIEARPTLRMLAEDLDSDWRNASQLRAVQRALQEKRWDAVQPLSSLRHPILDKCRGQLGNDTALDAELRAIQCSTEEILLEVRSSQWRAGVWTDPGTGVRWVCMAGLAKGEHRDYEDFYERLRRIVESRQTGTLMPTERDRHLLRRETLSRRLLNWQLDVQAGIRSLIVTALSSGAADCMVPHPTKEETLATVALAVAIVDSGHYPVEEIYVEINLGPYTQSELGWTLTTTVLTAVSPPMQDWDRVANTYSTMNDPGTLSNSVERLELAAAERTIVDPQPGSVSHYAHRKHIGDATVNGTAVRARPIHRWVELHLSALGASPAKMAHSVHTGVMAGCCDPRGCDQVFGPKFARRVAAQYRKKGLNDTTQRMVDWCAAQGVEGATVLEIGGGVGEIGLELLKRGAAHATTLELSGAYDFEAAKLAAEAGLSDRVSRRVGDIAVDAGVAEMADIVVLHRVVCCYPDPDRLLPAAAEHARRLVVYSHPPRNAASRTFVGVGNAFLRLVRREYRTFAHDPEAMVNTIESSGFTADRVHQGLVWGVVGARRTS